MSDPFVKDPAFRSVTGETFAEMMDVTRYAGRTALFDGIIGQSHDHYWDPNDPAYIDYTQPFDLERDLVLPMGMFPELYSAPLARLDEPTRIALANENARWLLSGILHGEQAALALCARLANMLVDPGTQEFIANQAREESRHVTAFANYMAARWGAPYPPGETIGALLCELVETEEVYRKFVGMQILVEGLAMSIFATVQMNTADPVLKRLTQLVITDESFHHSFGKTWAELTVPDLAQAERDMVEDWAVEVFETLVLNLINVREKRAVYARFGLDWAEIAAACEAFYGSAARREQVSQQVSIFRSLAKMLVKAGIVTARTRHRYAAWLDMDAVEAEEDYLEFIGDLVSATGLELLDGINRGRKPIGKTARVEA
ncbi:MAG: ferritin-like domain-containing protein [Pseudomonadota bacterium]